MRYIAPRVTGTYAANSVIQGRKGTGHREIESVLFTPGPAYQSEE